MTGAGDKILLGPTTGQSKFALQLFLPRAGGRNFFLHRAAARLPRSKFASLGMLFYLATAQPSHQTLTHSSICHGCAAAGGSSAPPAPMVSLPALGQLGLDAPLQLGLDELVATKHPLATEPLNLYGLVSPASTRFASLRRRHSFQTCGFKNTKP
jgi:hypothetical protein